MRLPMLICRSTTSPSTITTTRDRRRLKPTIIGNVPRRDNWTKCSGWSKNACSAPTGGALQKPPAATRAAESSLGAGQEPGAGAGESSPRHRIRSRGQSLRFRELSAAATALSEGRGAAPSPACQPHPTSVPPASHRYSGPGASTRRPSWTMGSSSLCSPICILRWLRANHPRDSFARP